MVARLVCALLWLFLALPALAAEVRVQLEPARLQVGQTGRVTVLLIGGQTRGAPQLEAPEGVRLEFDNRVSQRMIRSGFDNVMVYSYGYRITALQQGRFEIGGWEVPLKDGTSVLARTAELEVVDRQSLDFAELQLTAGFHTETAWEGEVVVYGYQVVSKVPVAAVDWRLPDFKGFRQTESGAPQQFDYTIDEPGGGKLWVKGGAVPLVVTGTGDRGQVGALVRVQIPEGTTGFFGFSNYRSERVVSEAAPLFSRPLPPPPDGFSGLVGDFEIRSRLDRTRAVVGESVIWTLDISGNGDLDGWEPPSLPDLAGIAVYDNDGTVEAWVRDETYAARGSFNRVLVPNEAGTLVIPPIDLVVFSPAKGKYITHRLDLGSLVVTQGKERGGDVVSFAQDGGEDVEREVIDFRDNFTWGLSQAFPLGSVVPVASGVVALPAFGVLFLAMIERLRARWTARRLALERPPTVWERLAQLPEDRLQRLAALDAILRQALAERFEMRLTELDRDAAIAALPDDLREPAQTVWRSLDRARFAAAPSAGVEDAVRELLAALKAAE